MLFFREHNIAFTAGAWIVYAVAMFALAPHLRVSSNYIILVPVVASAISWGSMGGIVAGILGLPANLLIFQILGHPDYSPENKVIAEISGAFLGLALGGLSDYFSKLEREISKRKQIESALLRSLEAQSLLLDELHHRVRNNLNLIVSILRLQESRAKSSEFLSASKSVRNRIMAIAWVHERLHHQPGSSMLPAPGFFGELVDHLVETREDLVPVRLIKEIEPAMIEPQNAYLLGLALQEGVTNALRHAKPLEGDLVIRVRLSTPKGETPGLMEVFDNGAPVAVGESGLGMRVLQSLAASLEGKMDFTSGPEGSRFTLSYSAGHS